MVLVVKYGGAAIEASAEQDSVLADCVSLVREGHRLAIVHGGGPAIDAALREKGIVEKRVGGLRATSLPSLKVVESVLCATVNKALVRALLAAGVSAVGISGEDGPTLIAQQIAPRDGESLGFVGEIVEVRPQLVATLLEEDFVPVVAPLGVAPDGSTAYNINGDTAAGALAGALRADAFVAITDVPKIRRDVADPASAVDRLDRGEIERWREAGLLAGGMLPKVDSALRALETGAKRAIVAGTGPAAIRRALDGAGTEIFR
ncbi:MAG: acetylglutamate kinase [Candidatus Eremiobacteraeota bacterium]|nr:acetylglutamate kinase [Candidatus Eremiobacteraeota bacterium]